MVAGILPISFWKLYNYLLEYQPEEETNEPEKPTGAKSEKMDEATTGEIAPTQAQEPHAIRKLIRYF